MVMLMRKNYVIIRNFGVQLSLYYQMKLNLMKKSCWTGHQCKKWQKSATVLSEFLTNITNLGFPQHIEGEPISQNIDDPLIKAIIKSRLYTF